MIVSHTTGLYFLLILLLHILQAYTTRCCIYMYTTPRPPSSSNSLSFVQTKYCRVTTEAFDIVYNYRKKKKKTVNVL